MTRPVCKEIRIPNETSYLAAVREAVREVVLGSDFPGEELNRLTLAVDESVTNVMEHAYENDLEGDMFIEVALEATGSEFVACIRDWGTAFDPTAVPTPDLSAHVREGRRHGLGIFLIRQIMDEAGYTSDADGRNELKLVKRVARAAVSADGAALPPPAVQAPEPSRRDDDAEEVRPPAPVSAARAEPDLPAADRKDGPAEAAGVDKLEKAAEPAMAEETTKAGETKKAAKAKKAPKAKKASKAKKAGKTKKARKARKPK